MYWIIIDSKFDEDDLFIIFYLTLIWFHSFFSPNESMSKSRDDNDYNSTLNGINVNNCFTDYSVTLVTISVVILHNDLYWIMFSRMISCYRRPSNKNIFLTIKNFEVYWYNNLIALIVLFIFISIIRQLFFNLLINFMRKIELLFFFFLITIKIVYCLP